MWQHRTRPLATASAEGYFQTDLAAELYFHTDSEWAQLSQRPENIYSELCYINHLVLSISTDLKHDTSM